MSSVDQNLPKRVSQVINGTLALGEIVEDLERLPETDDKKMYLFFDPVSLECFLNWSRDSIANPPFLWTPV